MTTESSKFGRDAPEPMQLWLVRTFDKKMANYHLVELKGQCFFQHKERKNVLVCPHCAEDCKRHFLKLEEFLPDSAYYENGYRFSLECNVCKKFKLLLSDNVENAKPIPD